MRRTTLLAGFSAATLLTGMAFAHANPTGPKGGDPIDCGSDTLTGGAYSLAWDKHQVFPPNHKMVPVTLTYTSSDNDRTLDLSIGAISHDEYTEATDTEPAAEDKGSGATPYVTDMTGSGTSGKNAKTTDSNRSVSVTVEIRAERAGTGTGRTYSIPFTAKSTAVGVDPLPNQGEQNTCEDTATVFIPHDMGAGNDGKE